MEVSRKELMKEYVKEGSGRILEKNPGKIPEVISGGILGEIPKIFLPGDIPVEMPRRIQEKFLKKPTLGTPR